MECFAGKVGIENRGKGFAENKERKYFFFFFGNDKRKIILVNSKLYLVLIYKGN